MPLQNIAHIAGLDSSLICKHELVRFILKMNSPVMKLVMSVGYIPQLPEIDYWSLLQILIVFVSTVVFSSNDGVSKRNIVIY